MHCRFALPHRMVYFLSTVMYKPATLSMWMVLMSTSHITYWRRVKSVPPKEQTNILPGTPELPDSYASAFIVTFVFIMFGLWGCVAVYFLPLQIVFFPSSLMILFGVPIFFLKVPIFFINWACVKLGIKNTAKTGLLEMKVITAVTIVAFISSISYVGFYQNPVGWAEIIKKTMSEVFNEVRVEDRTEWRRTLGAQCGSIVANTQTRPYSTIRLAQFQSAVLAYLHLRFQRRIRMAIWAQISHAIPPHYFDGGAQSPNVGKDLQVGVEEMEL